MDLSPLSDLPSCGVISTCVRVSCEGWGRRRRGGGGERHVGAGAQVARVHVSGKKGGWGGRPFPIFHMCRRHEEPTIRTASLALALLLDLALERVSECMASPTSYSRTWPEAHPAAIRWGCVGFHLKQKMSNGDSSTIWAAKHHKPGGIRQGMARRRRQLPNIAQNLAWWGVWGGGGCSPHRRPHLCAELGERVDDDVGDGRAYRGADATLEHQVLHHRRGQPGPVGGVPVQRHQCLIVAARHRWTKERSRHHQDTAEPGRRQSIGQPLGDTAAAAMVPSLGIGQYPHHNTRARTCRPSP
jgi:hypothetical protein